MNKPRPKHRHDEDDDFDALDLHDVVKYLETLTSDGEEDPTLQEALKVAREDLDRVIDNFPMGKGDKNGDK